MQFSLITLALATIAAGHMHLERPVPLGLDVEGAALDGPLERFNEQKPFPCRGHLDLAASFPTSMMPVWQAGSDQTFQLGGSSPHFGGSSQVSLSYDGGATWKAIKSFPGSCPHRQASDPQVFTFNVPREAPSATAIFSWSWFNRENEMYHNCAMVRIVDGGDGLDAFPDMLVAEVGARQCTTPSTSSEVLFPNMGEDESRIEYGDGQYPLVLPVGDC